VGQAATCFAGIDVRKGTLDACPLGPGGRAPGRPLADDPAGHAARLAWADRHAGGQPAHLCLEATGPYSGAVAARPHAAGRQVSVANPARVRAHAASTGPGNKTGPADAGRSPSSAGAAGRGRGCRRRRRPGRYRPWPAAGTGCG